MRTWVSNWSKSLYVFEEREKKKKKEIGLSCKSFDLDKKEEKSVFQSGVVVVWWPQNIPDILQK